MSVLFKSPSNGGGTIGGSSKGFPPGDISNIIHIADNSKVLIKWQDPEDTIIDGLTLSKWKGTILVRNNDHYPNNIKDGDIVIDNTIRNKYKDIWYEDTGLTNDITYYYRFFTYSENKVYNDSGNMIFKDKPIPYKPILKDNNWTQIANASESGNIPDTWNIGDEIDLVLSGTFNETVTLQIWDFNHFDKTDGTGKAGICFGMKNLMKDMQYMDAQGNDGGWNSADNMRNTVMNNIYNSMSIELRNAIKEVNTYANKGGASGDPGQGLLSTDKVFLPGYTEIDDKYTVQNKTEQGQKKIPIFTDSPSRQKKLSNGAGYAEDWYTRSAYYGDRSKFRGIDMDGDFYNYLSNTSHGVCFCFNI